LDASVFVQWAKEMAELDEMEEEQREKAKNELDSGTRGC
jgi:hypothetical protein